MSRVDAATTVWCGSQPNGTLHYSVVVVVAEGIEIATRRIFLTIGKTWCACKSDHVLFLDRVRFDIWRAVIISLASHV
jgi:hypothetical protein